MQMVEHFAPYDTPNRREVEIGGTRSNGVENAIRIQHDFPDHDVCHCPHINGNEIGATVS